MDNTLRKYNSSNLEVTVYGDEHSVTTRCMDEYGTKVYIKAKSQPRNKFDLDIFCDPSDNCNENKVKAAIHDSIDVYFKDLAIENNKALRQAADNFLEDLTNDLKHADDVASRNKKDSMFKNHLRLISEFRKKHKNPKKEIEIFEMYVKNIEYGKAPEVLKMLSDKFGRSTNSLKVLMGWFGKNFIYAKTISKELANTGWDRTVIHYAGNVSNLCYDRKHILASISEYKQNLN